MLEHSRYNRELSRFAGYGDCISYRGGRAAAEALRGRADGAAKRVGDRWPMPAGAGLESAQGVPAGEQAQASLGSWR